MEVQIGQTVSYQDMANPYREGVIVDIIKKESGSCFLIFGEKSSMEEIPAKAVVIFPETWHRSHIPTNNIKENEYAGNQLQDNPIRSQSEVDAIVAEYERMQPILRAQREQTAKDKQEEKEKQQKQLIKQHPDLIQVDQAKYNGRVVGSKNLKYELNKAFPGVKFSVTSDSFSMGSSIDVRWSGEPSGEKVREIANKYQYGDFDGMEDLYNYSDQVWTDVFGGAKYVCCQRDD